MIKLTSIAGFLTLTLSFHGALDASSPRKQLAPSGCQAVNSPAATPPMGWNPWNVFRTNIDEARFLGMAHTMIHTGLTSAGYCYVNIDDGWWESRTPSGLRIRTNLFPSAQQGEGLPTFAPLVDKLHALGLRAGIYTDIGHNACSQAWDTQSPNLPSGSIEAREVGSYGHQEQDALLFFKTWHFDFVKVDGCGIADFGPDSAGVKSGQYRAFQPLIYRGNAQTTDSKTIAGLYSSFEHAVGAASTGRARPVFEVCVWGEAGVNNWAYQGANLWRTSADVEPTWKSMLHNFDTAAPRALFAGPGHWNDPDMLEVGNGEFDSQHLTEARTQVSLWAIIAAPLILSYDLRLPQPTLLDIVKNREMIAIDQDPAGNQGVIVAQDQQSEVLVKSLSKQGSKAIAMVNRTDHPLNVSVALSTLHLDLAKPISVRDIWEQKTSTVTGSTLERTLAPHQTALLTVQGTVLDPHRYFLDETPSQVQVLPDNNNFSSLESSKIPGRIGYLPSGEPIVLSNQREPSSIGVSGGFHLRVKLDGQSERFQSLAQIAEGATTEKASHFSIYGDGKLLFSQKSEKPVPIDLDVRGVHVLELWAQSEGDAGTPASYVWSNPEVQRSTSSRSASLSAALTKR